MTKLNYEKLRHLPRPSTGTMVPADAVDLSPKRPLDRLESHAPFAKWCIRCGEEFLYVGAEERPPLIRCCRDCRQDIEDEARLNELDSQLADDVLVKSIRAIAAAEKRISKHGYRARRAREAGHVCLADRERRRMVLAYVERQAIVNRS